MNPDMNEKDLLLAMGDIDDKDIEEAAQVLETQTEQKRGGGKIRRIYLAGSVAAACLVLVIGAGLVLSGRFRPAQKAEAPSDVQFEMEEAAEQAEEPAGQAAEQAVPADAGAAQAEAGWDDAAQEEGVLEEAAEDAATPGQMAEMAEQAEAETEAETETETETESETETETGAES